MGVACHRELPELTTTVEQLEAAMDKPDESEMEPVISDPELVHKIAHACLDADYVSEEEELRILRKFLAK